MAFATIIGQNKSLRLFPPLIMRCFVFLEVGRKFSLMVEALTSTSGILGAHPRGTPSRHGYYIVPGLSFRHLWFPRLLITGYLSIFLLSMPIPLPISGLIFNFQPDLIRSDLGFSSRSISLAISDLSMRPSSVLRWEGAR